MSIGAIKAGRANRTGYDPNQRGILEAKKGRQIGVIRTFVAQIVLMLYKKWGCTAIGT